MGVSPDRAHLNAMRRRYRLSSAFDNDEDAVMDADESIVDARSPEADDVLVAKAVLQDPAAEFVLPPSRGDDPKEPADVGADVTTFVTGGATDGDAVLVHRQPMRLTDPLLGLPPLPSDFGEAPRLEVGTDGDSEAALSCVDFGKANDAGPPSHVNARTDSDDDETYEATPAAPIEVEVSLPDAPSSPADSHHPLPVGDLSPERKTDVLEPPESPWQSKLPPQNLKSHVAEVSAVLTMTTVVTAEVTVGTRTVELEYTGPTDKQLTAATAAPAPATLGAAWAVIAIRWPPTHLTAPTRLSCDLHRRCTSRQRRRPATPAVGRLGERPPASRRAVVIAGRAGSMSPSSSSLVGHDGGHPNGSASQQAPSSSTLSATKRRPRDVSCTPPCVPDEQHRLALEQLTRRQLDEAAPKRPQPTAETLHAPPIGEWMRGIAALPLPPTSSLRSALKQSIINTSGAASHGNAEQHDQHQIAAMPQEPHGPSAAPYGRKQQEPSIPRIDTVASSARQSREPSARSNDAHATAPPVMAAHSARSAAPRSMATASDSRCRSVSVGASPFLAHLAHESPELPPRPRRSLTLGGGVEGADDDGAASQPRSRYAPSRPHGGAHHHRAAAPRRAASIEVAR